MMEEHKKKCLLDFVEFFSSSEEDSEEEDGEEKFFSSSECLNKMNEKINESDVGIGTFTFQENDSNIENIRLVSAKKKQKKTEVLNLISQLKLSITAMEKEKKSSFYKKSGVKQSSNYVELANIEVTLSKKLNEDKHLIKQQLHKISSKVVKFKREKSTISNCARDLEKLKALMEDIENHIMQFKEKQRLIYEETAIVEKQLLEELFSYDTKFERWSKFSYHNKQIINKNATENKEENLPVEVQEFEKFVKVTGGYQGGWDDIDHQLFLRFRKQIKNDKELLDVAGKEIPTQSLEDIQQHIEWYKEFNALREGKREAIRLWKHSKENDRKGLLSHAQQNLLHNNTTNKMEKILEREREERYEQLKQWKLEKENMRKRPQVEDDEAQEKSKLKVLIEQRKKSETKLKVEEYKRKKKEEESVLKHAMDEKLKREKIFISSEEIVRIKERNEKIVASKKQQIVAKEFELEEKERRLEKMKEKVVVSRDPSRLYQLTEGCKLRRNSDKTSSNYGDHARLLPHKAVPGWRQGLH